MQRPDAYDPAIFNIHIGDIRPAPERTHPQPFDGCYDIIGFLSIGMHIHHFSSDTSTKLRYVNSMGIVYWKNKRKQPSFLPSPWPILGMDREFLENPSHPISRVL
jgi:hypothetical protein